MNNTQRSLFAIFIPMTILIAILDNIFPQAKMTDYIRYTIMISLFLVAIFLKKKSAEQKLMALALFFVVVADFFLVFSHTIDKIKVNLTPFGMLGFACAYICLILAYQKSMWKAKTAEIIAVIPILIILMVIGSPLFGYIKGVMKIGAVVFAIILCYMLWTSICTIFRGYYNRKISIMIAISGILMFICDVGVAHTLFHPYYSTVYVAMLKNVIWISYIIGWTLLDVIISENT